MFFDKRVVLVICISGTLKLVTGVLWELQHDSCVSTFTIGARWRRRPEFRFTRGFSHLLHETWIFFLSCNVEDVSFWNYVKKNFSEVV